eukprot:TRINITY_DN3314_c0_g2_i12.p1 TRINITY_DN3314_c0_g2~~TRINITY_DN3314_c0_g2_i12.p1  ORF type:complete len:560 (+),score=149.78 TRINITY_DN3314_c0_g2_i12:183-1862(+)
MKCSNSLCTFSNVALLDFACDLCREQRYCSHLCKLEDWNSGHSLICERRQLEKLKNVELNCPFVKAGKVLNDAEADSAMPKGEAVHKRYEAVRSMRILGKGSYGEVTLMSDKLQDRLVALKTICKKGITDPKVLSSFSSEIDTHKRLVHENIIRLLSHTEDAKNIYIVMEYANRGTLFQVLRRKGRFSDKEAFFYFMQICSAVEFLHRNQFMHRDIKPENLLLTDKKVLKLCDFGCCTRTDGRLANDFCGTIEYMAPEMLRREKYGAKVDVWSLGVLLYEMLHGYAPYRSKSERDAIRRIARGEPVFRHASEDARELIESMLSKDPSKRPEVWEIFLHPWVKRMQRAFGLAPANATTIPATDTVKRDSNAKLLAETSIEPPKLIQVAKKNSGPISKSLLYSQRLHNSSKVCNYFYSSRRISPDKGTPQNIPKSSSSRSPDFQQRKDAKQGSFRGLPGPKVSSDSKIAKPLSGNVDTTLESDDFCPSEDTMLQLNSERTHIRSSNRALIPLGNYNKVELLSTAVVKDGVSRAVKFLRCRGNIENVRKASARRSGTRLNAA